MKLHFKLANGLEFSGDVTTEQLKKIEANGFFKKLEKLKAPKKITCGYYADCERCYHKSCEQQKIKALDLLSCYINSINLAEDLANWMSEDDVAEFYKKYGYDEIRDLEKELGY